MAQYDDLINQLTDQTILGNTVLDYLISVIIFIFSYIIIFGFRRGILRRLSNSVRLQDNHTTSIIINTTRKFLSNFLIIIVSLYLAILNLSFPSYVDSVMKIIILTIIAWLVMKFLLNLLDAVLEEQEKKDKNIHILEFFRIVARSFIIIIVTLWYLSNLGVDVTAFLASLGFVSLAIAFALKETISDLFASIVIFIDRPFEIGDAIKVDNQSGTVEKIGIRSTKIRAPEGFLLVSSNRDLTNKKIHNFKRMDVRRIEMVIQIDQSTPSSQLRRIPSIIEEIINSFDKLSFDKLNLVNVGDFSYDFNLVYFVNTRDFMVHALAKQEILIQMLEKFEEEGIMLPYPTQTIIVAE